MIPDEEKEGWHYLAVKKTICVTKRNNFKHDDYFYCQNCLHSFTTENKLKCHKKVCKSKDFCGAALSIQKDNTLKFNQYMKLDKIACIIYADLESLIKKQIIVNIIQKNL